MQTELETRFSHIELPTALTIYGRVLQISAQKLVICGLSSFAKLGDQVSIEGSDRHVVLGEIIFISDEHIIATPYADISSLHIDAKAFLCPACPPRPCEAWIGKVLDHNGYGLDGQKPVQGLTEQNLKALPPKMRKPVGERLQTKLAALDTFLPLCHGQRIGLFAGSGVGKSTLLADLARGADADVVVLALIGERGREVHDFTHGVLGDEGMKKSIVFVATSDQPPALKLRAAWQAMASAEYFRDKGKNVLLLFDSLTRFAEAHRSLALSAGETPSLRAFPPSTFDALARLCERAGPGAIQINDKQTGNITAVFSVLVAGSNMDEPVADMVRGILDGHVVLERDIAERGRYPAIDIRRSVSRTLPDCATDHQNQLLIYARRLIGAYEDAKTLISAGLYQPGGNPVLDEAVQKYGDLDKFITLKNTGSITEAFDLLDEILMDKDTNEE